MRESMGMTQEKLAILSSVSERTVQRAEAGLNMSLETLNDFASALEMPLSSLVSDPEEINSEEAIGLRRVVSIRAVIDELETSGVAVLDCELDPNPTELQPILDLVGAIEARLPSPWNYYERPGKLTLSQKLVLSGALMAHLQALSLVNIGLYTTTSWIKAKYPQYDPGPDRCCTNDWTPYTDVKAMQLVVARSTDPRLYRKPVPWWGLEVASGFVDLEDDDVPF
ncbi:MAG TPA: helix-turn-helix transcriptional regulator [Sphingomonas sp.]|uniref:helix-turn-helix domain-containing protein n=1 Tax=Sphingomonas sp. TaxID=28214 RepID=UPI002ED805C0